MSVAQLEATEALRRGVRRHDQRCRLRGIRPLDPEEAHTTAWFRSEKKIEPHPRHRRKVVDPVSPALELAGDIRHGVPKLIYDLRRQIIDRIEDHQMRSALLGEVAPSIRRHPDDELEDALALRYLEEQSLSLALRVDLLEASEIAPLNDGLPPLTDVAMTLEELQAQEMILQ